MWRPRRMSGSPGGSISLIIGGPSIPRRAPDQEEPPMTVASRPVLVTGAAGFLGGAVMSRLRKEGRDVVGLDLKEDSARGIRGCDLSRSEELRLILADLEIDSVVHCG